MKKLILLFALFISGFFFQASFAQVTIRVNISSQPIWGPVGYDHVDYYYLPDMDMYYYVPRHKFIYMENGHWISRSGLPPRYKNYDMYNARKVVVNEPRPYLHHQYYRERYESSDGPSNQKLIRDSRESRYYVNKDHPEHSRWKENRKNQVHREEHGIENGRRSN
jgi:hypothetical protein